ncbi:hypothetical protein A9Q74_07225 [Colwellia sp. 39_35_sub15_T18]|nr:hypothetical protein A9Q74_07225 [Colwellia sp. 39_35_sub15_T18]
MSTSNVIPNLFIRRQLGPLLADENKSKSLLRSHNIDLSALTSDGYTESTKLAELAKTVWHLLDDESTGVADKKLPVGFFNMLCHACSDCKNLKSVLHRTCNFFALFSDEYKFSLEVKGEEAIFSLNMANKPDGSKIDSYQRGDYFILYVSIVLLHWYSWLINEPIKLERVEFSFFSFLPIDDYESMYRCAVTFEEANNSLIFSNDFLNKTIAVGQEKLADFLINVPYCFLSQYKKNNSTADEVRKILSKNGNLAQTRISTISELLHCSIATLTRKLKAENTSFMEIKDRTRKVQSLSLLKTTDLSITEISNLLGFSESSAFTRAFKKWTGDSPMEYRSNCS